MTETPDIATADEDHRDLVAAPEQAPQSPMQMLYALARAGVDTTTIKELVEVSREMAKDEAKRQFDAAMSEAKGEIPVILKNRSVGYEAKTGGKRVGYQHEDLAQIARTVDPILQRHGLSYRFKVSSEPNHPITVRCIIAHKGGHAEETSLSAGADSSGQKNSIQAIGSAVTYLQRYTLKAALGLAAAGDDDGGKADEQMSEKITDEQRDKLLALLAEADADVPEFCEYAKIDAIPNLPANRFDWAVKGIEKRKAAMAARKAADNA